MEILDLEGHSIPLIVVVILLVKAIIPQIVMLTMTMTMVMELLQV